MNNSLKFSTNINKQASNLAYPSPLQVHRDISVTYLILSVFVNLSASPPGELEY